MTEYQGKYYDLYQFFGGYFHQDWQELYDWKGDEPDTEKVVRNYKFETIEKNLKKIISEMESLLSLNLSEKELRNVLMQFSSCHYAPATHGSYRNWLETILKILKEPGNAVPLKKIS